MMYGSRGDFERPTFPGVKMAFWDACDQPELLLGEGFQIYLQDSDSIRFFISFDNELVLQRDPTFGGGVLKNPQDPEADTGFPRNVMWVGDTFDHYVNATTFTKDQPLHWFGLFRMPTQIGNNRQISGEFPFDNAFKNRIRYFKRSSDGETGINLNCQIPIRALDTENGRPILGDEGETVLYEFKMNGANSEIWHNGVLQNLEGGGTSGDAGSRGFSGLRVWLDMQFALVCEWGAFNAILSDTDQDSIHRYFERKWEVTF